MDSQTVPTRFNRKNKKKIFFFFLNFDTSGVHHSMARTLVIDSPTTPKKVSTQKRKKMGISGIHPVNGTMRG
jgi:hypothetical protein